MPLLDGWLEFQSLFVCALFFWVWEWWGVMELIECWGWGTGKRMEGEVVLYNTATRTGCSTLQKLEYMYFWWKQKLILCIQIQFEYEIFYILYILCIYFYHLNKLNWIIFYLNIILKYNCSMLESFLLAIQLIIWRSFRVVKLILNKLKWVNSNKLLVYGAIHFISFPFLEVMLNLICKLQECFLSG